MAAGGLLLISGAIIFNKGKESEKSGSHEIEKAIEAAIANRTPGDSERVEINKVSEKNTIENNKSIQEAEDKPRNLNIKSEAELEEYRNKNGLDFEKYIVQLFDRNTYKIKSWTGDKYVNGIYAETSLDPDILFEMKGETINFAVECKWRKQLFKGGVSVATEGQLSRYRGFEKAKGISVFMAIGLGGQGASPERIFIIPLRDIESNFIHIRDLRKYERKKDTNLGFDTVTATLR